MAQQSSDQHTLDFTSLTDAIIPSNIYLSSWNQPDLRRQSDSQVFPFSFDTSAPAFGGAVSLASTANPLPQSDTVAANHTAFIANSPQQLDTNTTWQDRGVQMTRSSTGQQSHADATPSRSEVSESNVRAISTKDPLANLKMRAKESVMAKRAQSIRSPSSESKASLANVTGQEPPQTEGSNNVVQIEEPESLSCPSNAALPPSSVQSSGPLPVNHKGSAKAPSLGLEDLIAEGRAAASSRNPKIKQIRSVAEQSGNNGTNQQHIEREGSETGEIEDHSQSRGADEVTNHQLALHAEHFAADEIDEIDVWLEMTGYYDKAYRDKVFNRHKRLQEIEEEKSKLLEEEQQLRGQFHNTTPFRASQRSNPPAATTRPPPSVVKKDVGLRIKDIAAKTTITPPETTLSANTSLKRAMEEETTDTSSLHQSKVARTEVHRKTPTRSQRASPARRRDRSVSVDSSKKYLPASRRTQSPHSRDDRWLLDREVDHRGATDRLTEHNAPRRGHAAHQRRDSGVSTSFASTEDKTNGRVRFFLLKSWNYENIAAAQKEGTWATQTKNEDIFVEAFKTCRHVIFFFSANHSKAFQGYARMQGLPGEKGVKQPSWVKNLHWPTTEPFKLRWIVKEETPYRAVGNLKNPLNENLAIFVGRDGQEIPEKLGTQLCDIIDEDVSYRAEFRR